MKPQSNAIILSCTCTKHILGTMEKQRVGRQRQLLQPELPGGLWDGGFIPKRIIKENKIKKKNTKNCGDQQRLELKRCPHPCAPLAHGHFGRDWLLIFIFCQPKSAARGRWDDFLVPLVHSMLPPNQQGKTTYFPDYRVHLNISRTHINLQ